MARTRQRVAAALAGLVAVGVPVAGCFQIAGYDDFSFEAPFRGRLLASSIERLDLLFVIDNSRGMADKHAILQQTLDAFIDRLVDPPCLDRDSVVQPSDDDGRCLEGSRRTIAPVRDMHLGVITTSLGGHGGDVCPAAGPLHSATENDRAHLIDRRHPDSPERVPTYQDLGFLAWDPDGKKSPPGESDVEVLKTSLSDIVGGVGAVGCGYEAPLEAWYRFLIEPEPYVDMSVVDGVAVPVGIDEQLLAQRAAFVRPDSLLVIVMLTDENDCSIIDGGGAYAAAQVLQPAGGPFRLPPPRAACAVDPNDPCCRSCAEEPGPGCDDSADDCTSLTDADDSVNLRCFDQKRRFGIDFLYPIDRYVVGTTQKRITDRAGNVIDNPLAVLRDPGRIVLAGIVGVPWQDIARIDAEGAPNLERGLDVLDNEVGGVKDEAELLLEVGGYESAWAIMLGDSDEGTPAADPFMREAIAPREGKHPLTPDALSPPGGDGNTINGGEYSIPNNDALQHACLFKGRDCAGAPACKAGLGRTCGGAEDCLDGLTCAPDGQCAEDCTVLGNFCECQDPGDNPACKDANGVYTTYRHAAAAYPGVRQLAMLRASGYPGVVGSICPKQVDDPSEADFGFTPALNGAIVERLQASLKQHLCLDRSLFPNDDGFAPCVLIEARKEKPGDDCVQACTETGRRPATDAHAAAVALAREDPDYPTQAWSCFCEIVQVESQSDRDACQNYLGERVVNQYGGSVDAWCFVDALATPPIGAPDLTAGCPADRRRIIRLAGLAEQVPGSRLFLYCE